jgi:outer membrane protein assembly factor BamB
MVRWGLCVVVVAAVTLGCSPGGGPEGGRAGSPPSSATASSGVPELRAAWGVDVGQTPFQTARAIDGTEPNEGPNPIDAGDHTVVLGEDRVLGLDTTTGATDWTLVLPAPVCATAPSADAAGAVVLLTGTDGSCTDVVALDAADGTTLWTVPVPRAAAAFGHEVSLGADSVVVTGECAGFTVFSAADGAVVADVPGEKVGVKCPSATSDGTSVVLSSGPTLSVHDARTGERTASADVDDLGRIGNVVSSDPLVVTVSAQSRSWLAGLSGAAPLLFGRDHGSFGGVPAAAAVAGGVLWVQYDDVPELVGYDPTSGAEVATIPVDPEGDALVGTHDARLVVTTATRVGDTVRSELRLYDPSRPEEPQVVGLLPPREAGELLSSSAVVGDVLVRVWRAGNDAGRAEGIELPASSASDGDGTERPGDPGDPSAAT